MIFKRHIDDRVHPYVEWGWYNSQEQFNDYIAGVEEAAPSLRVRITIEHYRNEEPYLVNASNGLLEPEVIPIMVQLLEAAYEYHLAWKVKKANAPV